jgi:ATP-dependent Clp protease ATP-binding subunit ClpB
LKDRNLPDSAIDLLDRTMASVKIVNDQSANELKQLQKELDAIDVTDENALSELWWLSTDLKNKTSHILLNQLDDNGKAEETDVAADLKEHLQNSINALLELSKNKKETIHKKDIAAVISYSTGIPIGKIQSKERDKLLKMGDVMKQRVVGQDHAVKVIADAIIESRSGLTKAGQPIGSFFLLGPTGTGKTELAKTLADFLFNDEQFLLRFDMSEFKEEHSAALLYGAPPGYVGYEEGGLLVNKIREKPYSVVLFDEIEKAHPSVFDIFLQIMDEGKLHDRLGKEGDFSNAVVLFTSNIGSDMVTKKFDDGSIPSANELMEMMGRHFRPEFLARLTEIIPFAPISEANVVKIFEIHLQGLVDMLEKQGIKFEITTEAKKHLAISGFTPKYGARPLKGVIRNQLRRPISRMIVADDVKKGCLLKVDIDEKKELKWQVVNSKAEVVN